MDEEEEVDSSLSLLAASAARGAKKDVVMSIGPKPGIGPLEKVRRNYVSIKSPPE